MAYNRDRPIPGVSGRRIPGSARMPRLSNVGAHMTNVPHAKPYSMGSDVFREFHRHQVRDARGRFAGGWGFAWQGLADIADNVVNYGIEVRGDVKAAVEALAEEMKQWAQANAPWQDQTGDARRELQAGVTWTDENNFVIWLGHGADIYYGVWLEVRWGGKFAIILPTIQHFAPLIGDRVRAMT